MFLSWRLTYNIIIQNAGKILTIFLNIAILGYISRYLGVAGMGDYATIIRFIGLFGVIADFGLNVIVTREIARNEEKEDQIIGNAITLRFFSSIVILVLGASVAQFFPYDPVIKKGIFLVLPAFWFTLQHQILNGLFLNRLKMDQVIAAEIISRGLLLIGTILLIQWKTSLISFLYLLNIGNFVWFVTVFLLAYRYVPIRFKFDLKLQKKIFLNALPLALINGFHLIYFNIDSIMLSIFKGPEALGIYHVAYKILETLFTMMVVTVTLYIPLLSNELKIKKEMWLRSLKKIQKSMALVSFLIMTSGLLASKYIVLFISGESFVEASNPLKILFITSGFIFFNELFKHVFVILDKQKSVVWLYATIAVFNVLANLYVIPIYSYNGAAFITLLSEMMVFFLSFIMIKKYALSHGTITN